MPRSKFLSDSSACRRLDPRRIRAGAPQRLHDDPRVDEPFEADEAVGLRRVLVVTQRRGQRRAAALHQRAVLADAGQADVVVARHDLRVHQRARVVAAGGLAVLDQQPEHGIGAHERHVGDRHRPAEVARGAHEGAAALVGAGAEHDVHAGPAQRVDRRPHVVLELGAARVGRLDRHAGPARGQRPGHAVGATPAVGVRLGVDAEGAGADPPEALDQRRHLLPVGRAHVEHVLDVGRLPLRLGAGEVADEQHLLVGVPLDHRQGPRERRGAHVVRQEEHVLLLQQLDGVLHAGERLVVVVEPDHRDRAPVHAAPRVDLLVVGLGPTIELRAQTRRGALERRAHPHADVRGGDAGSAGAGCIDGRNPFGRRVRPRVGGAGHGHGAAARRAAGPRTAGAGRCVVAWSGSAVTRPGCRSRIP